MKPGNCFAKSLAYNSLQLIYALDLEFTLFLEF